MPDSFDTKDSRRRLILLLSLLIFSNISCFTIISSFTKSNFLTAIETSSSFKQVYGQAPYFILYCLSSVFFIMYSVLYYGVARKISFERRVKAEILALMACSLSLILISTIYPDYLGRFLPSAFCFVVMDIFDELILLQTWTLINYCINIRESKKYQYVFLFSGSVGALISGYYILRAVPDDKQFLFGIIVMAFSMLSYGIVSYLFSIHGSRIKVIMTATQESLKSLFSSKRKYKIITSVIHIVIVVGIFNLFFKVLFDTQVNTHFTVNKAEQISTPAVGDVGTKRTPDVSRYAKTKFIGQYKGTISIVQVLLQLAFAYLFVRLWLNGRILYAYPLLLIPNLLFITWVYVAKMAGHQNFLFWGTMTACGLNEILKRIVFDSAYQLLMFSIPDRLCNAIRMYSKFFFKPIITVGICLFFILIPPMKNTVMLYSLMLILALVVMIPVVYRIPKRYVDSLKQSVRRRSQVEETLHSLINLKSHHIIEQYKIVTAESDDLFSYLYILNLVRYNYVHDMNSILVDFLNNEHVEVRLDTLSVIREVEAIDLTGGVEELYQREGALRLKRSCLEILAAWGPTKRMEIQRYTDDAAPLENRKYGLTIAHRYGTPELKEKVEQEVKHLLNSSERSAVFAGIWLVGELKLIDLKQTFHRHFKDRNPEAFDVILGALTKLGDLDEITTYLKDFGYERIHDYSSLNRNLAMLGEQAFDVIFDMIVFTIRSKSHLDLQKCLRALRFIPTQDAIDFLADILFRFSNYLVKIEALVCIGKLRSENPHLNCDTLIDQLMVEIDRCREFVIDYVTVSSRNPDSLLLTELARNIEAQVWIIFRIMDILYPDLAVLDSYYRITHASSRQTGTGKVKAKSIEYLESIIKREHSGLLDIVEAIRFDDGYCSGVKTIPGNTLQIEEVYERIIGRKEYWLILAGFSDMPYSVQEKLSDELRKGIRNMMSLLEKCQLLKSAPGIRGWTMMEMMLFAELVDEVSFEARHVVFEVGDPGDASYSVIEGRAELLDKSDKQVLTLKPGDGFGLRGALDNSQRRYSVRCIEDCRLLRISSEDLQDFLENQPRLYKKVLHYFLAFSEGEAYKLG